MHRNTRTAVVGRWFLLTDIASLGGHDPLFTDIPLHRFCFFKQCKAFEVDKIAVENQTRVSVGAAPDGPRVPCLSSRGPSE